MNTVKHLIIGGGLSGHNAAKAIRAADPQGSIMIVSDEPDRPYDRPPLAKGYMQGKVPAEKGFYESPEWYQRCSLAAAWSGSTRGPRPLNSPTAQSGPTTRRCWPQAAGR